MQALCKCILVLEQYKTRSSPFQNILQNNIKATTGSHVLKKHRPPQPHCCQLTLTGNTSQIQCGLTCLFRRNTFPPPEMHVMNCTSSMATLRNLTLRGRINWLHLPVLLPRYLFMFALCWCINPIIKGDLCTKSSDVLQALNGGN